MVDKFIGHVPSRMVRVSGVSASVHFLRLHALNRFISEAGFDVEEVL